MCPWILSQKKVTNPVSRGMHYANVLSLDNFGSADSPLKDLESLFKAMSILSFLSALVSSVCHRPDTKINVADVV